MAFRLVTNYASYIMNNNPFYRIPYYPEFNRFSPDTAEMAIQMLLKESHDAVEQLERSCKPLWQEMVVPLYEAERHLSIAWSLLHHMLSVANSAEWRSVEEELQPKIISFYQRVGQSKRFYEMYCAIRNSDEDAQDAVRQRILSKIIQAAEHSGVALDVNQQMEFNELETELGRLATKFNNNLLDARKAFSLTLTDVGEVAGLPADLRAITAAAARDAGSSAATADNGPWRITLDYAVYAPFMKHSQNREARETLYRQHVTLASHGTADNQPLIDKILALKQRKAAILGFQSAAELSLSRKMAPDVAAVYKLFDDLASASRQAMAEEQRGLLEFACANGFEEDALQPWDLSFWAERQHERLYGYSEEELSQYFQFPKVLKGMFDLAERIFNIKISESSGEVPVWHDDVRFYKVFDQDDNYIACFYLDPYSRPATKQGGAWMNDFRTRERSSDGAVQLPMAVMCCNQSVPIEDQPSLMRMGEVTTLFHEFGHALQHILTSIDEPMVSGINGIEWDAVEIASQFMENWCYEKNTLKSISAHVVSGAELPDELFEKIVLSKNHLSATAMMRQIFLSATDMDLYARYPASKWSTPNDVKCENARKYDYPMIDDDRFLCSFAHIFGGGYSAGYYSYKWSEVLSADCFAAFEESGVDNAEALRQTGLRMRETIMGLGGSVPPMEAFKAFRGRDPDIKSLLRLNGIVGRAVCERVGS